MIRRGLSPAREPAETFDMHVRELVCGNCGAINRASAGPCWRCRAQLERPTAASHALPPERDLRADELERFRVCPSCHAENRTEAEFCWRCQRTLHELSMPTEMVQPRSRSSYAGRDVRPEARSRPKPKSLEHRLLKAGALLAAAGAAALVIQRLS